jgi:putative two-component system response regulator
MQNRTALQPLTGHPLVLVVDDDRVICELAVVLLREQGYECEAAYTPEEARDALRRRPVSLCLCDLYLGPDSGFELAQEIAQLAPDVALVMMSGSNDVSVVEKALQLGAYDYVLKPFRESELAIAVRNALHRRQLEQESRELRRRLEDAVALSRQETIHRLARAVEFRDTPTGRHVERMSAYCRLLAQRLGIAGPRAALIQTASLLHDIGKLGIPDRILSKPARLSDDERREMQAHTTLGHKLLSGSSSELVELAATIALTHHERVDGRGYPHNLRADEIPLEGRIAAVCDVFDALTSPRPYRVRPFGFDEAIGIMRAERGGAFDPELLDPFLDARDEVKRIRARHADNGTVLNAA